MTNYNNSNTENVDLQVGYKFAPIPCDVLHVLIITKLNPSARHVFEYLLDQQFGYIKDGNIKNGDSSGYGHISKILNYHRDTIIDAVAELVSKNMIFKIINATKFGNFYSINTDTNTWTSS